MKVASLPKCFGCEMTFLLSRPPGGMTPLMFRHCCANRNLLLSDEVPPSRKAWGGNRRGDNLPLPCSSLSSGLVQGPKTKREPRACNKAPFPNHSANLRIIVYNLFYICKLVPLLRCDKIRPARFGKVRSSPLSMRQVRACMLRALTHST